MAVFYYKPDEDTFLLMDATFKVIREKKTIILGEIGCGSGEAIIQLSEKAPLVLAFATDRNIYACRIAKDRIRSASDPNIQVIASNLADCFRPLGNGSILTFNPPYLPENSEEDALLHTNEVIAFVGGKQGWETGFRLASDALTRLRVPAVVIFSTIAISKEKCLEKLSNFGQVRIIALKKLSFEELFAIYVEPFDSKWEST